MSPEVDKSYYKSLKQQLLKPPWLYLMKGYWGGKIGSLILFASPTGTLNIGNSQFALPMMFFW